MYARARVGGLDWKVADTWWGAVCADAAPRVLGPVTSLPGWRDSVAQGQQLQGAWLHPAVEERCGLGFTGCEVQTKNIFGCGVRNMTGARVIRLNGCCPANILNCPKHPHFFSLVSRVFHRVFLAFRDTLYVKIIPLLPVGNQLEKLEAAKAA